MRKICFDFGGSMTDMVILEKDKILEKASFEKSELCPEKLEPYLLNKKFDQICVTGGNLKKVPDKIFGEKIRKVGEIEAIGRGGLFLYQKEWPVKSPPVPDEKVLIASLGTGCCFVKSTPRPQHIGGTAIGGGTLMGLGKAILGINDVQKMYSLAKKGKVDKIDLSVRDIVGEGIGLLPGWAPASHFAKYGQSEEKASKEDLARGIFSLCAGVIASSLVFAARSQKIQTVILGGRLAEFDMITEHIRKVAQLFEIDIQVVSHPEVMVAVGAGLD